MKIAIYGPMCSGKTTVANIIKNENNKYKIYSFGGRIKELAIELFNMEKKHPLSRYGITKNLQI